MLTNRALSKIRRTGARRLVVGFSGGIDSHALLHALARSGLPMTIHALHINHGLSPFSDAWQEHCAKVCERLEVGFTAMSVLVSPGSGVEERARSARYDAFVSFLQSDDLLLLAHHADDQVETVLLTLFRGGNRPGLAGMPEQRPIGKARLLRPLLDVDRASIEAYAVQHDLGWIVDQSNDDIAMNRNYLRHRVLPVIKARWPDVTETLLKELDRTEELTQLIDYLAKNDLASIVSRCGGLSVEGLKALDVARRKNVLRYWISSFDLPLPGDAVLSAQFALLLEASEDAAPLLSWQGTCLRRTAGEVFLTASMPSFDASAVLDFGGDDVMDVGGGKLTASLTKGSGVGVAPGEVSVKFRQGGERIRIGRNRTLKNVFQEAGVPTWLRGCLPLIFKGDELVAVAALPAFGIAMRVAGDYRAKAEESGFEFSFEVAGHPYSH